MKVQAKPLTEITRNAIDLLSKEMGIVDTVPIPEPVHDRVRKLHGGT